MVTIHDRPAGGSDGHEEMGGPRVEAAVSRREFVDSLEGNEAAEGSGRGSLTGVQGWRTPLVGLGGEGAAAEADRRARDLAELGHLLEAAARTPELGPEDLAELGYAFESAGHPAQARSWFALVVERDPVHPGALAGLRRLGAGQGASRLP